MKSANSPTPDPAAKHLPLRKKILFITVAFVLALVLFEGTARVVYYVSSGFNPYYLEFGFVVDTQFHSAEGPGYTKFQPNTVYHQKTHWRTVDMRINADGFRNLHNFVRPKPPGTFRVVTLGESSTFGYGLNEDNQTYPYQLEQMLRHMYPGRKIEVYNLGIPHFRSDNILALAKHEVPGLQPDLITVYAGYNNAVLPKPRNEAGLLYHIKDWFYFHSVAERVIHVTVRNLYYTFVKVTNRDPVGLPNLAAPAQLDGREVALLRSRGRAEYRSDFEQLAGVAQHIGCPLMLITQTYTLRDIPGSGLNGRWRKYQEEVDYVENLFKQNGHISAIQASLLVHRDLMDELRALAKERNLPLVDGIAALDPVRPQAMASYVHLNPLGNQTIATAIANEIRNDGLIHVNDVGRASLPIQGGAAQ
jgi:lysophospholipase L1-like esterase